MLRKHDGVVTKTTRYIPLESLTKIHAHGPHDQPKWMTKSQTIAMAAQPAP